MGIIYTGRRRRKGERKERGGMWGAGGRGKLTQPSGVVERVRVGSTDCCVGLTSRHLTRARKPFLFPLG